MSDDLVKRMRKLGIIIHDDGSTETPDELTRLRAENERLRAALEETGATIKIADALAEGVGLVISTTDPRVYLQAFDGVRVSHDAYRKSRAAIAKETGE